MQKITQKPNKLFILFFVLFLLLIIPMASKAQTVQCDPTQCKDMKEGDICTAGNCTIQYDGIDELGNRKIIVKTVDLGTDPNYIDSPFLTDYLAAMYRYAVIVTTILATIVIIFAGVLWITSAGNTEQIGRAKKMIGRSITGLLLAVGSYTILWTINPQLVEFGSLKILRVANISVEEALGKEDQDKDYAPSTELSGIQPIPEALGLTYTMSSYFGQGASPWGSEKYSCGTYKNAGCAPTSIAMVLKRLGETSVTPPEIGKIAENTGAVQCGKGTSTQGTAGKKFMDKIAADYTVKYEWVDEAKAKQLLKEGKWLIQSGKQAGFTGSNTMKYSPNGHYIVLTGITQKGGQTIYTVNDPGRQSSKEGITYQTEELFNKVNRQFLYIHK